MTETTLQYRLLALDLDGTLLNDRSEISDTNAEWIARAADAGIAVVLSTGRGYVGALPYAERLGLETPMITVNGGQIWSKPHALHRQSLLAAEQVMRLHALGERYGVWFWAYSTEGAYNRESWAGDTTARSWLKFGYHSEDVGLLRDILAELGEFAGLELSNSSPYNIEINPAGVSKATAMAEVCRLLGLTMAEAAAVGDSMNDIEAIRAAGLGVAMGNAQEAVKSAADRVTGTNQQDGVAAAIRKYILRV